MKQALLIAMTMILSSVLTAQVSQLVSNKSLHPYFLLDSTKGFFTSEIDSLLWVTNGTPTGTKKLSTKIIFVEGGGLLNGKLIFVGRTDSLGRELYITNGTAGGTKLIKDIYPGFTGSDPDNFAPLNGKLYFTCKTAANGRELWVTNGTSGGTTLVKDIVAGVNSSNTVDGYQMFYNDSLLLFSAKAAGKGYELWKSNGTAAGTALLKDIYPGDSSSNPGFFALCNNEVLFVATNGVNGRELWKTNGTAGGTSLLKDINPGTASSLQHSFFFLFNGKAFFVATHPTYGDEIWMTNGTPGGTGLLKDIWSGTFGSYAQILGAIAIGNKFYFSAFSPTSGFEMWESNGTTNGTVLFKDIAPGTKSSNAINLLAYKFDPATGATTHPLFQGNKFFFMATTTANGTELWVCDGTSNGTKMVKDIRPGKGDGITDPAYYYTSSAFYFAANDSATGSELWKTNGTLAGTSRVADINPGLPSADINFGFIVNDKLVFRATNGDNSKSDIYRLDANVVDLRPALEREIPEFPGLPEWTVKIMTNPVRSQLNYNVNGLTGKAKVTITDISGRIVLNGTSTLSDGSSYIPVGHLRPGIYIMTVENESERKVSRFVKQ